MTHKAMGSIDKACISGFLCRLCSEMHRTVIHIYGDQGKRLCLVEKINGYLPITISPTDPLPKTICTSCLRRVEQHYDLLMRLSRIKQERIHHGKKKRRRNIFTDYLLEVSSPELSEDEGNANDNKKDNSKGRPPSSIAEQSTSFLSTNDVDFHIGSNNTAVTNEFINNGNIENLSQRND